MQIVVILLAVIMLVVVVLMSIVAALLFLGMAFYVLLQFAILAELCVIAAKVRTWKFYGLLVLVSVCAGLLWQQPSVAKLMLPLVFASVAPLRVLVFACTKPHGYWMNRNSGYKIGVIISSGLSLIYVYPLIVQNWSTLAKGGM